MKFLFSLITALLTSGLAQPALSASSVVILQCSVDATAYIVTAGSDGENVRNVDIGESCARELEVYLNSGFKLKKTILGDQSGFIVTYTLLRSQ